MSVLLLHGSGWDEFLMLGGAIALAFIVVKITSRAGSDEPAEDAELADHDAPNEEEDRAQHPQPDGVQRR